MQNYCKYYFICPDIRELSSGETSRFEDLLNQHEELCTQGGVCKIMEESYKKQGVKKIKWQH